MVLKATASQTIRRPHNQPSMHAQRLPEGLSCFRRLSRMLNPRFCFWGLHNMRTQLTTRLPYFRFLTFALSVPKSASSFAFRVDGTLRFNNDSKKWPGQVPCLYFAGGQDIALVGGGTVDGNGAAWWPNRAGFRPGLVTTQGVTKYVGAIELLLQRLHLSRVFSAAACSSQTSAS
jgi:hypothetical protein